MVVVAQMTQMIGPQLEALRKMTYCFYSSQNISATLALLSNMSPPIKKLRSRSQKCLFQKHLICFMAPEKIQRYVITNVLTFGLHFDPHFEIFSHLVHGWQLDFLAMFFETKTASALFILSVYLGYRVRMQKSRMLRPISHNQVFEKGH